ncbi:protein ZBED8-like [Lucilia cuprina]|uniref:protein ZBED8-like n=1 Tax=Lucilia cuprina TaxID=7375 RepID=UPI001F064CF2|nr:protein ZBED8-like [Lucilia cuprina]
MLIPKCIKNVSKTKTNTMETYFGKQVPEKNDVADFEIRLSLFFAEHNLAAQAIDHLIPLLKEIAPDSSIIKKCQLGRIKCTKIIQNVLSREEKENLIRKLQIYKFSVLLDESTDVSSQKTMCLLVRYYDEEQEKTFVQLLELIHVGADCTAEALYGLFKKCILSFNIRFDNIIGPCCDGANVMVGQNNSFASRLLKDNPDVITIKCICHTAAIIANKSCLMLPRAPEDLVRQIGTYISGSSKRCSQLEKFQEMMNKEKRKILRTSTTRWLSHQKCIERILDNWQVLVEYFKFAIKQDKLKSADVILTELTNE